MPKKKSGKRCTDRFLEELEQVALFLDHALTIKQDRMASECFGFAVIWIYREFEKYILALLVHALNANTQHLATRINAKVPRHLTAELCEYLILGDNYFNFRAEGDLRAQVRKFVPDSHYLYVSLDKKTNRVTIDRLIAMRNFAAHQSKKSKERAKKAYSCKRMASAGAFLKKSSGKRMEDLLFGITELALEIAARSPY